MGRADSRKIPLRSDITKNRPCKVYVDDRPTVFKWACHGDPDRCFHVSGRPMYLCARCIGFYIGSFLGLPLGVYLGIIELRSLYVLIGFALMLSPMAVDGLTQYKGMRRSNQWLRLSTGLLAGSGGGIALAYVLTRIFFPLFQ